MLSWSEWAIFLLVFVRITAFFAAAPLFANRGVPNVFKIGLAFFLSLIAAGYAETNGEIAFDERYLLLVVKEALVGIALGFAAAVLLTALQIAGGFIDLQIGFAIANLIDPQTGIQGPLTGNFKYMLALLFLLSMDGHLLLLEGLLRSFEWITVDRWIPAVFDGRVSTFLTSVFGEMFAIALMIALPVVGSLFLVDLALGIIAKTVPQMNVFVLGLSVKILSSFLLMLIGLPGFFYLLLKLFREMIASVHDLMRILGA
ncbi:flagellar biosynthetic protein FliR [Bacillaceae bacterium]